MEYNYDVIVIGAGNAGLMAALTVAEKGKKVLVLESNSIPGGLATSFVRGRFEFEASLREMNGIGTDIDKGYIRKLFDEYNLNEKLEWLELPEAYRILKVTNPKEDYLIPFGLDEFIKKLEEYVPNSKDSLTEFFELAKEVHEAFEYINNSNEHIDYDYIKEKYPNFAITASYPLQTVLDKLKINKTLQYILTSYWPYFGTSAMNINFAHYVSLFYEYISKKAYIPKYRSYEISVAIERKIRNYGGDVWYNEKVNKILINNGQVTGVTTKSGKKLNSNHVICNSSPTNVYSTLIDQNNIPKKSLKLTNSRKLGAKAFTVYLGLSKSALDLGIKNYMYIICNSLDSNIEFEHMKSANSTNIIATCINNVNPEASPSGTCILNLTALYFDNCWDKILNEENYYTYKERVAYRLIEAFEKALEVNIKDYIEEIEISSPVTYSKYNASPDGCIYGYMMNNIDSKLYRMLNKEEDNSIKGLRLCGAYSYYGHGFDSTYKNGNEIGLSTIDDIEKGDN